MSRSINLSVVEWQEISNALWTKEQQLRNGDFGETGDGDDVNIEDWADQLKSIQRKIGPDAKLAIKRGVAPTTETL